MVYQEEKDVAKELFSLLLQLFLLSEVESYTFCYILTIYAVNYYGAKCDSNGVLLEW